MENNNLNQITHQKEYPEITISSLTDEEKNILLNIYAGSKSEFTSLCQYSFEHILFSNMDDFKECSIEIEEISITEMIHLEIIGKILNKAGIIPKFCRYIDNNPNICQYWNSGYVKYSTDYLDIIKSNIALEEAGINEYKKLLKITGNDNLKEIIKRILEDEYLHLTLFNKMLKNNENQ